MKSAKNATHTPQWQLTKQWMKKSDNDYIRNEIRWDKEMQTKNLKLVDKSSFIFLTAGATHAKVIDIKN